MINDFRTGRCAAAIETDLCIIGAGAAGLALAREFLDTNTRVCVLESGGMEASERNQALSEGDSAGEYFIDTTNSRMRVFGGSCNAWGGGCVPLDGLQPRTWVEDSGWPFAHQELAPYYERAMRFLHLERHPVAEATFLSQPSPPPIAFDRQRLANQICAATHVLPGEHCQQAFEDSSNILVLLHANVLELETDNDGEEVIAVRVASLDGQSTRVHARQYVLAGGGIENPRLLLLSDSTVTGGLGNRHDLVGRYFMDHPSAKLGTLRTPRAEALTRPYGTKTPLDSAHAEICLSTEYQRANQVLAARARVFAVEESVPPGLQALRELRATVRSRKTDDSSQLMKRISLRRNGEQGPIETAAPESIALATLRVATGIGDILAAATRKLRGQPSVTSERVDVIGYFEQAPNRNSRVTLAEDTDHFGLRKVRVEWQLTELDRRTYRIAARTFGEELARACDGRFLLEPWVDDEQLPVPVCGSAHHMGTTRMDEDPRKGVVDRDCRVHGVDNLHVAGSSVFPACGWAFPTLTIIALSMRLADHLKRKLALPAELAEVALP